MQNMYNSKIIFSPYGFGAYGAPRDVQAHQFGSILIKPANAQLPLSKFASSS